MLIFFKNSLGEPCEIGHIDRLLYNQATRCVEVTTKDLSTTIIPYKQLLTPKRHARLCLLREDKEKWTKIFALLDGWKE